MQLIQEMNGKESENELGKKTGIVDGLILDQLMARTRDVYEINKNVVGTTLRGQASKGERQAQGL